MGNFVLKGHVSYATKRKYKWVAEFGKNTCEKCAALDGQIFDEDDVPYWPHPNCRCKVEEISVIDEIDAEIHEYKEEIEQLKLQANELLGDVNVLQEQVEKLLRETRNNEVNALNNKLSSLACDIYKLIDKIDSLNKDNTTFYVLKNIQDTIMRFKIFIPQYAGEWKDLSIGLKLEKIAVDSFVAFFSIFAKDGAALWKLASSKFTEGLDYINKNGELLNNVSDLKNYKLEKIAADKLKSQKLKKDARGIRLHSDSSLAKSVGNSIEFRNLITNEKIKQKLLKGETIAQTSLSLNWNPNNFTALHNCDVLNIRCENGTLYATILDTIDYNANELLVKPPRDLQEAGAIENYFVIVEIEEPLSKYFQR